MISCLKALKKTLALCLQPPADKLFSRFYNRRHNKVSHLEKGTKKQVPLANLRQVWGRCWYLLWHHKENVYRTGRCGSHLLKTCNKQKRVNNDLFFFSVEPSGVRLETHWVVGKMVVRWTVQNMRLVKLFLLRSLSTRLTSQKVWLSSENATAVPGTARTSTSTCTCTFLLAHMTDGLSVHPIGQIIIGTSSFFLLIDMITMFKLFSATRRKK